MHKLVWLLLAVAGVLFEGNVYLKVRAGDIDLRCGVVMRQGDTQTSIAFYIMSFIKVKPRQAYRAKIPLTNLSFES